MGIRLPKQSLPSGTWQTSAQGRDFRFFSKKITKKLCLNLKARPGSLDTKQCHMGSMELDFNSLGSIPPPPPPPPLGGGKLIGALVNSKNNQLTATFSQQWEVWYGKLSTKSKFLPIFWSCGYVWDVWHIIQTHLGSCRCWCQGFCLGFHRKCCCRCCLFCSWKAVFAGQTYYSNSVQNIPKLRRLTT